VAQQLKELLQATQGLKKQCDFTCTCHQIPAALLKVTAGDACSEVLSDLFFLLPQWAAVFSSGWESGKGHSHSARHANLDIYNK
jgi:hypothetical protein